MTFDWRKGPRGKKSQREYAKQYENDPLERNQREPSVDSIISPHVSPRDVPRREDSDGYKRSKPRPKFGYRELMKKGRQK